MGKVRLLGLVAVLLVSALGISGASAATNTNDTAFKNTWMRTDDPVARGSVNRTWMWGPNTNAPLIQEPYAEAQGGKRFVEYFDKSRMEINSSAQSGSIWTVTNGLLAEELVTGKMQLGDLTFVQRGPAQINVAGDPDDPNGPTYASFNHLLGFAPNPSGWLIDQTVNRDGSIGSNSALNGYGVTYQDVGAPTNHTVASVFWSFMTSSGVVWDKNHDTIAPLFLNAFYATGYPITEPYWTTVKVGGVSKQVLVQVFERRVLTFTPDNPDGWKVEAGNVGQHYYKWRYNSDMSTDRSQIAGTDIKPATVSYYAFGGATTDDINTKMQTMEPAKNTIWITSWVYTWTGKQVKNPDGTCFIKEPSVTYDIQFTDPLWEQPSDASAQLKAEWAAFVPAMAAHQKAQIGIIAANAHLVTAAVDGVACSQGSTAAANATKQVKQILADYDDQHDDVPAFP